MMSFGRSLAAVAILGAAIVPAAHCDPLFDGLTVYKGLDGSLTDQSIRNLAILSAAAAQNGRLLVWVAFKMSFVGDPALRTAGVIAQESAVKQELIESVVMPLVDEGHAEIFPDVLPGAPGCQLSASASALARLARSDKVVHIGYLGGL